MDDRLVKLFLLPSLLSCRPTECGGSFAIARNDREAPSNLLGSISARGGLPRRLRLLAMTDWRTCVLRGLEVNDSGEPPSHLHQDEGSTSCHPALPAGFEPAILALRGLCPRPLDEGSEFNCLCHLANAAQKGNCKLKTCDTHAIMTG